MLCNEIQLHSFLGSREEDFKVILPYMEMAVILLTCSMEQNHLYTGITRSTDVESGENWLSGFREGRLKIIRFNTHIYSTGTRANKPWGQNFNTLIIHFKFQPLVFNTFEKMIFQHFSNTNV